MAETNIEWADAVWNPVTGCTKVSAGCKNCYAEGVAHRFWAKQYPPTVVDVDGAKIDRPRRFTDVRTHEDRLDEPLRWRKSRRVFVNSMSDLFHDAVPDAFLDRVFGVMQEAAPWVHQLGAHGFELQPPRHTFLILTKRPERMRDYILDAGRRGILGMGLPPSIWLGVSCEDQKTADERIPLLLQTPAAVRFLSCEPLLGQIDLGMWDDFPRTVDWVIAGGESGPGARPCDVAWIRSLVEQCRAAEVACFVKQLGACISGQLPSYGYVHRYLFADGRQWTPPIIGDAVGVRPDGAIAFRLCDAKGGDPDEWPEDLRVREFPRLVAP